jgi:hypothetical protein
MLATAICLECYMKNDLSTSVRDTIECDWLAKWKEWLGNLANTPRQIMRTYVEALNIAVACLNDEMDCGWSGTTTKTLMSSQTMPALD